MVPSGTSGSFVSSTPGVAFFPRITAPGTDLHPNFPSNVPQTNVASSKSCRSGIDDGRMICAMADAPSPPGADDNTQRKEANTKTQSRRMGTPSDEVTSIASIEHNDIGAGSEQPGEAASK
jgi:hypothetical protein